MRKHAEGVYGVPVFGIDAITADGEFVHADEKENADLLWAARGAGPGFFALVTRFYIKVYPRYAVAMRNLYEFPIHAHDELFRWAHKIGVQTERCCYLFKKARAKFKSRASLWDRIRGMFINFFINSWDDVFNGIAHGNNAVLIPNTS